MHDEAIAQAFGQQAGKTTADEPVGEGGHVATRGKSKAAPPRAPKQGSKNGLKPLEEEPVRRTFRGQRIVKQTIALGTGGQIKFDRDLPLRSDVKFTARASYENVKYKFLDDGKVEEILILTVETDSFELLEVLEKPKQAELLDDNDQPRVDDEPPADPADAPEPGEEQQKALKDLVDPIGKVDDDTAGEAAAI